MAKRAGQVGQSGCESGRVYLYFSNNFFFFLITKTNHNKLFRENE